METAVAPAEKVPITGYCDKHPTAEAYARFVKGDLELHFCAHCAALFEVQLISDGWLIQDERHRLN